MIIVFTSLYFFISIHPPHAGRDLDHSFYLTLFFYFNPPAPCGAGPKNRVTMDTSYEFQSTRPMRGGTESPLRTACPRPYFNPPAPCGAGPFFSAQWTTCCKISIHPPHAGRDPADDANKHADKGISIHPPHAGRDRSYSNPGTLCSDFNPPAPCGAGPAIMHKIYPMHSCTIHNTTCSQTTIRIPTSVFLLIIRSPSACSPVFRCEPMGSALRASTSHGQIIRTSSGL